MKPIQTLNRRSTEPVSSTALVARFSPRRYCTSKRSATANAIEQHQPKLKFQAICAVLALSLASWGQIEVAEAKSLDLAGIRHSLQLATNNQSKLDRSPSRIVAQNSTNQTPPKPTSSRDGEPINNIKSPTKVQITNTKPITLQEALDISARNNREVQAARFTVTKSQSDVREAQAAKNIQVGLNSTLRAQGAPVIANLRPNQDGSLTTDLQGTVEASYSLVNQTLDKRITSTKAQVEFDRLELIRIERRLKGDVITAYYDLQQSDSASIINQAAIKDAARSLSDAQLQEKAGVGTKFDILRSQVQLATANQELTNSQGQQRTARKKLAQLLSFDDTTEFQAADAVRQLGSWDKNLEQSILLAFEQRSEIRQQAVRKQLVSFQDEIRGDDSAQVNLFANYNLGKTISNNSPVQDGYSLGARLSWNFWDGGGSAARNNRRRINDDISDSQLITARNQVRFEVEQAFNSLDTNLKNIATSTQSLQQAEESLKLARLRFQAGVGTQTDVIQAQAELAKARGNRITAILNYNRALSTLRTATEQVG